MEELNYTYRVNLMNGNPIVSCNEAFDTPTNLYKYYSCNERNISALLSQCVYVSSPDQLNDVFDTLFLNVDMGLKHMNYYKKFIENAGEIFNESEFQNSPEYRAIQRNTSFAQWNFEHGIISTTSNPYNDLMWAHYTNNEGFAICFDHRKFPNNFGNPIPISYVANEIIMDESGYEFYEFLFVNALRKKNMWKYEEEFRFLVHPKEHGSFYTDGRFSNLSSSSLKESRLQEYPIKCIQKIILGLHFLRPLVITSYQVEFSKNTGILRKALIDFAVNHDIPLEIIMFDPKTLNFTSSPIAFHKIKGMQYDVRIMKS